MIAVVGVVVELAAPAELVAHDRPAAGEVALATGVAGLRRAADRPAGAAHMIAQPAVASPVRAAEAFPIDRAAVPGVAAAGVAAIPAAHALAHDRPGVTRFVEHVLPAVRRGTVPRGAVPRRAVPRGAVGRGAVRGGEGPGILRGPHLGEGFRDDLPGHDLPGHDLPGHGAGTVRGVHPRVAMPDRRPAAVQHDRLPGGDGVLLGGRRRGGAQDRPGEEGDRQRAGDGGHRSRLRPGGAAVRGLRGGESPPRRRPPAAPSRRGRRTGDDAGTGRRDERPRGRRPRA